MSKLVGSYIENVRAFEPDYPTARNPWDAIRHPEQHAYVAGIIERVDKEEIKQPKYTEETREEIFRLRDAGLTLREIADIVKVSKSTACLYLQNRNKTNKRKTAKTTVTQPGTTNIVQTVFTISEVDIGKIPVDPTN